MNLHTLEILGKRTIFDEINFFGMKSTRDEGGVITPFPLGRVSFQNDSRPC